jgi:hypothetical protein
MVNVGSGVLLTEQVGDRLCLRVSLGDGDLRTVGGILLTVGDGELLTVDLGDGVLLLVDVGDGDWGRLCDGVFRESAVVASCRQANMQSRFENDSGRCNALSRLRSKTAVCGCALPSNQSDTTMRSRENASQQVGRERKARHAARYWDTSAACPRTSVRRGSIPSATVAQTRPIAQTLTSSVA